MTGKRRSVERTLRDGAVADDVQRLAQELLPHSREIAADVTERVLELVPEVAPAGVADAVDVVRESTDQNVGAILAMLAFGVVPGAIEPPLGTLKVMRQTVGGGGDVATVLRAYRVGHEGVWHAWSEHAGERVDDARRLSAVLAYSSERIFRYFDSACEQFAVIYREEFGAGPAAAGTTQREVVARLLGDDLVESDQASARLGYELRDHHVALVLVPLAAGADARGALDRLSEAAPGARVLAQPVGDGSWWGWLGWAEEPGEPALAALAAVVVPGVLVGLGEPGRGRDGFRRSHDQAREAERTGRLAAAPAAGVVRQREIELAALLCNDPDRARRLAAGRLGVLAARDASGARLRETLRVFLACDRNKARTADVLQVHQKTVAYRIARAEDLLGRPVTEAAVELEAALLIDRTLNGD